MECVHRCGTIGVGSYRHQLGFVIHNTRRACAYQHDSGSACVIRSSVTRSRSGVTACSTCSIVGFSGIERNSGRVLPFSSRFIRDGRTPTFLRSLLLEHTFFTDWMVFYRIVDWISQSLYTAVAGRVSADKPESPRDPSETGRWRTMKIGTHRNGQTKTEAQPPGGVRLRCEDDRHVTSQPGATR